MTDIERKHLGVLIANTAAYYGKQITKEVISMMVSDLSDLDFTRICNAYQSHRRSSKTHLMPTTAQIRDLVVPTAANKDLARVTSNAIVNAVSKHGYYQQSEARESLGEQAWRFVERFGGWPYICQHLGTHVMPTAMFTAQVRDVIESALNLGDAGLNYEQPVLEQSKRGELPGGLTQIGSLMKLLPQQEPEK